MILYDAPCSASLGCDFSFCTFQDGTSNTDALSEGAERHDGKSDNCNESFDGFHGRIPQVILLGIGRCCPDVINDRTVHW